MNNTERYLVDGFDTLTPEQVVDLAYAHIHKTLRKSANASGNCMYSGLGCAAAPFVKPEKRNNVDAYGGWRNLVSSKKLSEANMDLIVAVQTCHDSVDTNSFANPDNTYFVENFDEKLRRVCVTHGLPFPGDPA